MRNNTGATITISEVRLEFPGTSITPNVFVSGTSVCQQRLPRVRPHRGVEAGPCVAAASVDDRGRARLGQQRAGPVRRPPGPPPERRARRLVLLPARDSDLLDGEYWSYGSRHTHDDNSGVPSTGTQRWGYDLGVSAWDPLLDRWNHLRSGTSGASNTDFLVWNKPVYTMADGVITNCYRGEPDHEPEGDELTPGGNHFFIDHGDDFAFYGHLKHLSISSALCPNEGQNDGLNIPVTAGQLLGRVGNTGQSSGPHLHLDVNLHPFGGPGGVPLHFRNMRSVAHDTNVNLLGENPTLKRHDWGILHRRSLFMPNPCGFPRRRGSTR